VEQQVREHAARGDWPTGLAEGLSELTKGLAGLADAAKWGHPAPAEEIRVTRIDLDKDGLGKDEQASRTDEAPADLPSWTATDPAGDPARELERLLDRFRDQVRDAARDGGVTATQLEGSRGVLAAAAERLRRLLG
jgi:hypothetical protein